MLLFSSGKLLGIYSGSGFGRWVNLNAIKRLVEGDALKMEIIPNPKVGCYLFVFTLHG